MCRRHNPAVDLRHQPVAFGRREQRLRRDALALGIRHPQQDLEARLASALPDRARDRLSQQFEFVTVQCLLNFGNQLHVIVAPNDALVAVIVDLDAIAAMVLRGFARHARGRQRAAVVTVAAMNSAMPILIVICSDLSPSRYRSDCPSRESICANSRAVVTIRVRQQHAEIVAGKPRQHATRRQVFLEQSGKAHDDIVAGFAAEAYH